MPDDEKPPIDPIFAKLGQAVLAKTVAVAASRGMPVTVAGKPVDARALNAQADQALLSTAAELGGRAIQKATELASSRIQNAVQSRTAAETPPTAVDGDAPEGTRRPFGRNRRRPRRRP